MTRTGDGRSGRPPEPIILGVCADAAVKMHADVRKVRAMWLLGLLVLGPVAPLLYVAVWWLTKEE